MLGDQVKESRATVSMKESTYKALVEKQLEISNIAGRVMSMDQVIYELIVEHNLKARRAKKKK